MSDLTNEVPRFAVEGDKIFDYANNRYLEVHGELEDGESTWHLPTLHRLISEGKQTHEARTVPPSPQTQALIEQLSERAEAAEALLAQKQQELEDALAARDAAVEEATALQKMLDEMTAPGPANKTAQKPAGGD